MSNELERKEDNHTYYVEIRLSNLQEHQLDELSKLIGQLELNGVDCSTFNIQND